MLFTVNKSPFEAGNLESCLKSAAGDTPVLLYENGVYGASAGNPAEKLVREALQKHEIYALEEDLKARGLEKLIEGVKVTDYSGFVDLVEKHSVAPWI